MSGAKQSPFLTHRLRRVLHATVAVLALASVAVHLLGAGRGPDVTALGQEQFIRHLESRISHGMIAADIPGVGAVLLRDGEPVWSQAFGYADRENGVPLSTNHIMPAHSISKSVTAWGVMRLVDQGLIDLDDPALEHLGGWRFPDSRYDTHSVSVRGLLSLNAGVPLGPIGVHYSPHEAIPPLEESLTGDAVRLFREPGSGFAYSNSSFALLELLVETVTERSFAEYMKNDVLRPLGMHTAQFTYDPAWEVPLGYQIDGTSVAPYLYPNQASGGLFATIHDLGRFAAATLRASSEQETLAVLSAVARSQMYTPQVSIPGIFAVVSDTYGLGHFLEELPGGPLAVWHGGQGLGWMTHYHAIPESGDALVILTNSQRSWPFMAQILGDWSNWVGYGPVGMSRIGAAVSAMRILVGFLFLFALWRCLSVLLDWATGRRRLSFKRFGCLWPRGLELFVALTLVGAVLWASQQEYLFISSVFPDETPRLGFAMIAAAGALLLSTLSPVDSSQNAS